MKLFIYLGWILLLNGCSTKENKKRGPAPNTLAVVTIPANYDSCKSLIPVYKKNKRAIWNRLSKIEKENIFTKAVTETIIPSWIGTHWDFNGTTEIPQQGSIACGYFVTTVLRDAGLTLSRVKLAQCPSEQMITSLVSRRYISRFSNVAIEDFVRAIECQGYGLYIAGLDNHTGFIYNNGSDIYFIHSTFLSTRNVQKEKAASSWVLQKSRYKIIGKISADEKVLERWIN
jgi:hypothetical protein